MWAVGGQSHGLSASARLLSVPGALGLTRTRPSAVASVEEGLAGAREPGRPDFPSERACPTGLSHRDQRTVL